MIIPGANLLRAALRVLGHQPVLHCKQYEREDAATGRLVPQYDPPVEVSTGMVQPVPASRYAEAGIDYAKEYVTWYVPGNEVAVAGRGVSGDLIIWRGAKYQCQSSCDWLGADGWLEVTCVKVGPCCG
jgi:hypothetical protein